MDGELKRIAELLRPLWPGIVAVEPRDAGGSGARRYSGRCGSVCVAVSVWDDHGTINVTVGRQSVAADSWSSPDEMRAALSRAAQRARVATADLAAALGLEVQNGG